MKQLCTIKAGKNAYKIIKEEGLQKERIQCVLGAAGGPKWLVLYGLDKAIYKHFLSKRKSTVHLIGSSIATWRFAALAQKDGARALDTFKERYMAQKYSLNPNRDEITAETVAIMETYLPDNKIKEILTHPVLRLCIITARSKHLLSYEHKYPLMAGLAVTALTNAVSRKLLQLHFDRFVFYDTREYPQFIKWNNFNTHYIGLDASNLKKAIMASGAIPLVMKGVPYTFDGHTVMLRDGGLVDYQMDLPLALNGGIALYPHYRDSIIPGWFDKVLPYRRPHHNLYDLCMVCPSQEAIASLPYKKIPDRNDFYTFAGKDNERLYFWEKAVELGVHMAEEFMELVDSGKIKDRVVVL
ncbi:MAG: patatin-like phospholipase family protein [Spirochaetes bacterium]|nr:patatin-like phospholipase family protein [Spirochaetota bacterium]